MLHAPRHHSPETPPESPEALLRRVGAQRDKKAFIELFHYFAPRVKSYLLRQGADGATAEEIAQATMIAVWEKAQAYDPARAAASTWIFTIARNKRIDVLRREKYISRNGAAAADVQNLRAEEKEDYAGREAVDSLSSALRALPEEQARLVRMAFFEDKSHSAIARETHLPLGTVKSRLRLALDKLRRMLKMTER